MQSKTRNLTGAAIASCMLVGMSHVTVAYTPDNHERYTKLGAKLCKRVHAITIGEKNLKNMIKGVLEPDKLKSSAFQMVKQRFEAGSYGKQRNVLMSRVAAQSFHGSPNPTRPIYANLASDQEKLKKTIRTPAAELLPNRLALDVYSYDTNQGVRNKILINASQFLCVSFAHKDDAQSARKFGNLLHMIGDTYSASHVQRSVPQGSLNNCGTEKIEWHFSMDLISWKLHRAADKEYKDWRFRCLIKHTSDLMKSWVNGREAVRKLAGKAAKLKKSNENVKKTMSLLCNRILREDPHVLKRPAGGAAAGYSSASGTDNWRLFKKKKTDKPIQPVGLTGLEEVETFKKMVNAGLRKAGSRVQFWYPSRDMIDLCQGLEGTRPLSAPLRCTSQEIEWAMHGSDDVKTMWIPRRSQP